MNALKLGADFTVVVDDHGSWCDWFPTRNQAVSYARTILPLLTDRISVLDCRGAVIAEFEARESRPAPGSSPVSSTAPGRAEFEAPLASPIR